MPRRHTERGFTVIEVMITSALMLIVLAIVLPQLAGSITTYVNAQVRSTTTDQAQIALGLIEHDVLASNLLYNDNTLPNGTGIVHMQTYAAGVAAGGVANCVEYEVVGGAVMRRTTAPFTAWPAGWATVITGVVNSTQVGTPAVFSVPSTSQYRSLAVTLWLNTDTRTVNAAAAAVYTSTITGRAIPANQSSTTGPC
ncbi:MAG: type II secretion system GspH family protein [Actinomycetota bacterium]|nr:type II secretion system GspH family protein [Actinomycetota bacterium]